MRKLTEQQRADRLAKLAALRAEIAALRAARHKAPREAPVKAHGFALLPMLALLALGAAAAIAGHTAEMRQREALALHCARASDGADSSIADCYASRDLPLPEGI